MPVLQATQFREQQMHAKDLISEGTALLRPSLVLSGEPAAGDVVGVWDNRSVLQTGGRRLQHRISVDCGWLQSQGFPLSGVLSVFSDGLEAYAALEPEAALNAKGGDPLWGVEEPSFPPPEALCLYGSDRIGEWLAGRGWPREHGAEAVIGRTPEGAAYIEAWQSRFPLYRKGPAAVLGGWSMMWPEDGEYKSRGRLVLLTLRGAEPWIEVWAGQEGGLSAAVRIT